MKTLFRTVCIYGMAGIALSGCLTRSTLEPTRFFTISPTTLPLGDQTRESTLGIRPLLAARPYKLEIAYRAKQNQLAYFPGAEWAELPATLVGRAVADSIISNGIYSDAGDAMIMARPDYIFTGELRKFEVDYTKDVAAFVTTLSASIRSNDGDVYWNDLIEISVPLDTSFTNENSDEVLADVARAATASVDQLSSEVCNRIRTASPPTK